MICYGMKLIELKKVAGFSITNSRIFTTQIRSYVNLSNMLPRQALIQAIVTLANCYLGKM